MQNQPILTYSHVDISYSGHLAVRDINFTVNQGEILGVVGESGSGKSTIIKAAIGLLGPGGLVTRGDIWYGTENPVDLPDLPQKEMRKLCGPELGMIFQNAGASFCPIRKIGDQIYESMNEHEKISREEMTERTKDVFHRIGLQDAERVLDSYPFELSGGMNQRVGIAMGVLMEPKVLFADEPTSALDAAVQKQVVLELLKVRETFGTTIVVITHNIGLVRAMADKVLVMKKG